MPQLRIITGTFSAVHTDFTEGNIRHFSFEHAGRKKKSLHINRLTPKDPYMGRTAPLTSKRCIYSTNIGTECFKHALYSPFFLSSKCSLFHNANLFGSCVIHILYTGCVKIKENNSGSKGLSRNTWEAVHCLYILLLRETAVCNGPFAQSPTGRRTR